MDYEIIPSAEIVSSLASSTNGYMGALQPIFLFVIGIILAVAIINMLISLFNDWLYQNTILNEYTNLRQEEAELTGGVFGDFKTEKINSLNLIRRGNINDSVQVETRGERLAEIQERKKTLQSEI